MESATSSISSAGCQPTTLPAAEQTPSLASLPSDLSSMITMLMSFSALRDWLKLIVFGGVVETCRRLLFSLWHTIVSSFWITVEFEEGDSSFGIFSSTNPCSITEL
jgi:chaperone BCS1